MTAPTAKAPNVSVVMPAYNVERFIAISIESVLRQTYRAWELIIVNDGSTDGTGDVIARCDDPRIRVITQENRGLAGARNTGISQARGRFVALLDSDDVWDPRKLEIQLDAFDEDPEVALVYTDAWRMDESGRRLVSHRFAKSRRPDGWCLEQLLLSSGNLLPSSVMIRRDALETAGVFFEEIRAVEDWDLWWRVAARYKLRFVPRALVGYRIHGGTLSRQPEQMNRCDRIVMERAFSDPGVRRRIPPHRLKRLRRRAEAMYRYRAASRALAAGSPDAAWTLFLQSIRLDVFNLRQFAMPAVCLLLKLPFVSRSWVLNAVRK